MNQITKSLSAAEIAAFEARAAQAVAQATPAPTATFQSMEGRTKTVKLEWPITVDGKSIDKVELRRLTGRDFSALATMPAGADENSYLIGMMSGLAPEVIAGLDGDDFAAVNEAARDFLPRAFQEAAAQVSATGEATPQ